MKTRIYLKRLAASVSGLVLFLALTGPSLSAQINFNSGDLQGINLTNPTTLDFGPDGRLYVTEQYGDMYAYTITRNPSGSYSATAIEHITIIKQIQNHDDDGALNSIQKRQITGILATGTASNPVLLVSHSDWRVGGGGGGADKNLDTNSGIISKLSWDGTKWVRVDLVRGLARSEENHASNGLQIDSTTNTLYIAVGGQTNSGSPSNNFSLVTEYSLAACILSIDLNVINALPTQYDSLTTCYFKYNMPTLDDPMRANENGITDPNVAGYNGIDINDPFGGNDGLNQAKWVNGGPVQVYAAGLRNPYDLVIAESGEMYTWDNGANPGWGGHPEFEGTDSVTNNWVNGEPGSTGPGPNDAKVNNLDGLHHVTGQGYYGGHPNPVRANPAGAGLFTHDHVNGVGGANGTFRTAVTNDPTTSLPVDWPPVDPSLANPIEADFQNPGVDDLSLFTVKASTNGICEYTASNFGGIMKGNLLAASFNENIYRVDLNAQGSINSAADVTSLAFGFGTNPLDVIAQGDNDLFPGTIWVLNYGNNTVTVFEPQDFGACNGTYSNLVDDDLDGYTNADEIDNGTDPCNGANLPSDFDKSYIGGFLLSNLNDPDDDDDGILDNADPYAMDANNGGDLDVPFNYVLLNGYPGFGIAGLGFTGLMTNYTDDYLDLFKSEENSEVELIAGGAVGLLSFNNVPVGSALGSRNDLKNGWQFGLSVDINTPPFHMEAKLLGPQFQGAPMGNQFNSSYVGNGDMDNYIAIGVHANNGNPQIEILIEAAGLYTRTLYPFTDIDSAAEFNLYLEVDPQNGTIQPKAQTTGAVINVGPSINLTGALLSAVQTSAPLAIGVMAGRDATDSTFNATWDNIKTEFIPSTAMGQWSFVNNAASCTSHGTAGSCPQARHEAAYVQVGDKFVLVGGRENGSNVNIYDPATDIWTIGAAPGFNIHHFQAVAFDGLLYMVGAMTGNFPSETGLPNIWIYDPVTDEWMKGPAIPTSRIRGSAGCVVYNNKIYLVGGIINGHLSGWVNWLDEYNPATNTWTALADAPNTRDHFHAAVIEDNLYAVAGRRSGSAGTFDDTEADVDVYDFATNTWSTLPNPIPTERAGNTVAVLGNELLVIGGEKENGLAKSETEALYVPTGTWRTLDPLNEGRHGTQAIVNNNTIYLASGSRERGGGASKITMTQEVFALGTPSTPSLNAIISGTLAASVGNISYYSVNSGDSITQVMNISNNGGNQGIIISELSFSDATYMYASAQYDLPYHLAPGATLQISVAFAPKSSHTLDTELIILHSGSSDSTVIIVSGSSSGNTLGANPTSFQFSTTGIGSTNTTDITISNLSVTTLQVDSVDFSGPEAADFSTTFSTGIINSGNSILVGANYAPSGFTPSVKNAVMNIYHTGDNSPLQVALSGDVGCPVAGIPCDDGDANTFGDIQDGNCNCIGYQYTGDGGIGCNNAIEQNGMVVVEMESAVSNSNNWFLSSLDSLNGMDLSNASGSYYIWKPSCGTAPNYSGCTGITQPSAASTLSYEVFINTPGKYRIMVRSKQPDISYGGNSSTENNDFWLQFPETGGVYQKLDGTNKTTFSSNTWLKIYHNLLGDWKWKTTTVDGNPHHVFVQFDTVGTYTVNFAGRSALMALDRFVLFRSDNDSNNASEGIATWRMPAASPLGTCDFTTLYAYPRDNNYAATLIDSTISESFTLENLGDTILTVDSIVFSGTDAGDFSTNLLAGSLVNATTALSYDITFTPHGLSYVQRAASLTIYHSANNDPIVITLTGDVACPAVGTICDDGNALTTNDVQDGNCNCAGVGPTLSINSPADGSTLPYGDFYVGHTITNWPMGSGSNHFHLKIDGIKINSYYDSLPVLVSGLSAGAHQIKLTLATVDHLEVGVADSIDIFMCEPSGNACDDGFVNTVNDTTDGNCGCFGRAIQPLYSLHINAGGGAHTTANGLNFIADNHYINGGTYAQNSKPIANTTEDVLYQSERYSTALSYTIPLPYQGDYDVTLYYAEIHSGSYTNGARVFDASLEGVQVLNDYDIHASVGAQFAVSHSFSVNVTDGALDFNTNSSVGGAKISAISIVYSGISLVPSPVSYAFGVTNVGDTALFSMNLDNPNNIDIRIDSVSMAGADASEFFTTILTPDSIAADSTLIFDIGFIPVNQNSVSKSAQLIVFSTAENSPLSIDLTGSVACPVVGTSCDDGNVATINDQEDGNCNCVGVGPVVSIDSPANGDVLPYGNFNIDFSLQNWALDGNNHFDLWIDDVKTNAYYDSLPILISGLSAGTHELRLELEYVDHTEVGSQDSISVTICDPAGVACYDGDPNTINDVTDGNCGCAGTLVAPAYSMYINTGGSAFTATDGRQFIADAHFLNGSTYAQNSKAIANTDDDVVFQSERWNSNLAYAIPLPYSGDYQVVLYFAEVHSGSYNVGARVMDVSLEGSLLLDDYDIFAEVGAQYAVAKSFNLNITDGTLNIDFTSSISNAKLSGIGVIYTGTSLSVTPNNFSFNALVVGQSDTADFVLGNASAVNITVDSLSINGTNAVDFTTNLGVTNVLADSTAGFKVFFSPLAQASALRTADLMIYHSGDNTPLTVSLSGSIACPAVGTPCDDGNLATINDVEDGNCNCVGVGPVVTIDSPADGVVLPYGSFNIDFSVQNWPLNGANHLDLWIDDVKTNAYYDSLPILISGLSAGTHELRLELEYVDHTEVGSQDSITVTICDPAGLSCYDGDPNTINDMTDGNCGCAGTLVAPAYSMYINTGGSAYTATDGRQFIADAHFLNGGTYAQNSKAIANTDDDVVFQSERWNSNLAYAIPLPYSGDYQVVLYFAEVHSGTYNVGARVMDVNLEGSLVLDDYDIFAEVGAQYAVAKSFNLNITDGTLNIDFTSSINNAKLSGIGVIYTGTSLSVTPNNYSFNALVVGQSDTADFVLGNASAVNITVDSLSINGTNAVDFTTNLGVTNVLADSTTGFKVFFSPLAQAPALRTADLMIYHSGDNTPLTVSLSGSVACPAVGTPCDDGNLATINDVEDGNCNCNGVGPVVTIDSPAEGDVLPYGNFNIDFSLQNWPLNTANHLDLWIDDVKINAYYDSLPILISGLSAGTHELRLELEYVDHTEVGSQDSITITICDPAGLTCDDGDANTINDVTDGNCGCAGTLITPGYSFYINSGGSAYTAVDGRQFVADVHFSNGTTYTKNKAVSNTLDDDIFKSERYDANLVYSIPVPQNGNYEVTLYFAEMHNGSLSVGARVMDISLEGNLIMDDYDIFSDVGAFTATSKSFSTSVTDGFIDLNFDAISGNAKICAIGIVLPSADLSVSPSNIVFASTGVNSTSSFNFVLDNVFPTNIDIDSVVFSGPESGDFTTNLNGSSSVGAASNATFAVDFTPLSNTPQTRNATMTIYHTGTNSPLTVTLSGETSCLLVGQTCDDGDANTVNDVYDLNCNCAGVFEPLTQNVSSSATTTNLSVTTSSGVSTYKFYADGVLEATYNSNSVSHTWIGSSNRYFEFYPAENDFSIVINNINWDNSNLIASLSDKFSMMSNIKEFKLYQNEISGNIPSWICNMSQLVKIHMWKNSLNGSIPNEIGQLINLTYLDLRTNQITGQIPTSIGNLSNLTYLYLSANNLSGNLPRSIGNITGIRRIQLQGNSLNGPVPVELSNLINASYIYLHGNSFSSYESGAFATQGDMTKLLLVTNNLGQQDIDNILTDLVSSLGISGRKTCYVDLRNNSAPSVAGKALADSLIALGWTVLHDPLPVARVTNGPATSIDEANRTGGENTAEDAALLGSKLQSAKVLVGLYPNPAQVGRELILEIEGIPSGHLKVELMSIQGQIIDIVDIETIVGNNRYGYQVPNGLAEGQYILRLSQKEWVLNKIVRLK